MLLFLSDLVTSPIQTGSQVYHSLSSLSGLVKAGEWEAVGAAFSPEVHELVTQWETLSDSRRGELAGYAFGKHGADIFIPGAAAKVAAKGTIAVKELGAICKNFQSAEKVFVLEAVASGSNAGIKVGEAIASAERTLAAGEDLGLTTKQMADLKQAGALEQTVGKGRNYFEGNPKLQASYDVVKKAQEELSPHQKVFMPEQKVKDLIQQTGISTFDTSGRIPDNFLVRISDKGAGIEYVHPTNPEIRVRVMPGALHSPNPSQQMPYVVQMIGNKALDKTGKLVSPKLPEAHMPLAEFIFRE